MDMKGALNSLRPEVRICLILFLTQDWSHSQIASHLDIPLGTTKSHILRGIKLLKLKLNPTNVQKPQPSHKELESEKTI
jgi:DNA-directed RNA polymerase specialized sigma24 family protein